MQYTTPNEASMCTLLPVELVERILQEAWSSDLRTSERTSLFASLCLASHTFLAVFIRIALTNVHITSAAYARHYLRLLRTRAPHESNSDFFLEGNASQTANALCRSITFHADARHFSTSSTSNNSPPENSSKPAVKLYSAGDTSTQAISSTLYMLDLTHAVPNLRHVSIQYTDWGFDDIFDQNRLMPFPKQVTSLAVSFRFSPAIHTMRTRYAAETTRQSRSVLEDLRWRYEMAPHPFGRFALPHVKTLRVLGATTSFAAGMLEACQGAHTVEFDEHVELPVVPPWIRTVVIRDVRSRASRGDVKSVDYMLAARGVGGGVEETCSREMEALVCPVAGMDHERARRRLKGFCAKNGVQVVEV